MRIEEKILNLKTERGTVREYLHSLVFDLWFDPDGFNGKRPFGSSGWQHNIYLPMVEAGIVEGTIDSDGYLDDFDEDAANDLIYETLKYIFR